VGEPKARGDRGEVVASESRGLATKESGVQARTESQFPTLRPSEIRSPLPSDPDEAAHDPRVAAMRELYAAGDVEAALFIAATIDATPPGLVSRDAETVPPPSEDEAVTRELCLATTTRAIPRMLVPYEEVAVLPIDHRAGFLLAHIDGVTTLAEIYALCGMPEEEALTIVAQLLELRVITMD
jgi:hypothetical protein